MSPVSGHCDTRSQTFISVSQMRVIPDCHWTLFMHQPINSLIAFVLFIVLGGCATSVPLPENARSSIDAVSVSDTVTFGPPPRTHVAGPVTVTIGAPSPEFTAGPFTQFLTPGSGGVADAILASGERDKNRQYALFLKATGIDVAPFVRSEFESQLRKHPFFGPHLAQTAKYRFELEVPHNALVETHTFGEYYKVSIVVRARLIGPTGEVIADAKGSSCLFHDCFAPNKLNDILVTPELLREQYKLASRDAIQELLKAL